MPDLTLDPAFRIRRATLDDCAHLAEIGRETFADSFGADNTPEDMAAYLSGAFGAERQRVELAEPDSAFLLLEAGGTTAGYARIRRVPAPASVPYHRPMEIVRFYARKAWIGKGVGARLMQACLDAARDEGCDGTWLAVWDRNARAIAFYEKCGFRRVGTQSFRLGADLQRDLVMARALQPSAGPAAGATPSPSAR